MPTEKADVIYEATLREMVSRRREVTDCPYLSLVTLCLEDTFQ